MPPSGFALLVALLLCQDSLAADGTKLPLAKLKPKTGATAELNHARMNAPIRVIYH